MISVFITSVQGQIIAKKYFVCAKVRHSQCTNDPPVPLWTITEKKWYWMYGWSCRMLFACSQCSILFGGRDAFKWKIGLHTGDVQLDFTHVCEEVSYALVSDINFTSAKKMKGNLDKSIDKIAEDQNQTLETVKGNDTVKQRQASTPKTKKLTLEKYKQIIL